MLLILTVGNVRFHMGQDAGWRERKHGLRQGREYQAGRGTHEEQPLSFGVRGQDPGLVMDDDEKEPGRECREYRCQAGAHRLLGVALDAMRHSSFEDIAGNISGRFAYENSAGVQREAAPEADTGGILGELAGLGV